MSTPNFDALLAHLSTGAMPSASQLSDGLRDLSTQIYQVRTNLNTHVDENLAAHETINMNVHEARRLGTQALE